MKTEKCEKQSLANSVPYVTIFSIPKPFVGHIDVIQRNAIMSWLALDTPKEILLMGNDKGVAQTAEEFGVRHVPSIGLNHFGTPSVSSAFQIAQEEGRGEVVMFVNADILLTSDILASMKSVPVNKFMIACQRWDLDVDEPIDFTASDWELRLKQRAYDHGSLHPPTGMDCFVFPRNLIREMPPFGIGRAGWDTWLLYRMRKDRIPVIDASAGVTIVHQNHDYSHHPMGIAGTHDGPEWKWHLKLAGGMDHIFTLEDADWIFDGNGFKRKPFTRRKLLRSISRLPAYYPMTKPLVKFLSYFRWKVLSLLPKGLKDRLYRCVFEK